MSKKCSSVTTDRLRIVVPEQLGFGCALLWQWHCIFIFSWAPLPCCSLSWPEWAQLSACEQPAFWSLSFAHHTWANRGSGDKPEQGGNRTQSQLSFYMWSLTCPTCFFLSLAGLFLVKRGSCSIFNSESTFYWCQKNPHFEHCYATTITLFKRMMAKVKIASVRICFFLCDVTAPDVTSKGIFKAKLSLTINSCLSCIFLIKDK